MAKKIKTPPRTNRAEIPNEGPKGLSARSRGLVLIAFLAAFAAYAIIVIRDFSGPLFGASDLSCAEYIRYFFGHNLSFRPFPTLDLVNNQAFYPYGTNNVFMGWGFERDYFATILNGLFGAGPWIQVYCLLSVAVTAAGAFLLLRTAHSPARSAAAAFAIAFLNFYVLAKYPDHFTNAVIHWTALGIVADFLIVEKFVGDRTIPLRLGLARILLLVLALGQELGYVAGAALTSFSVSALFLLGVWIARLLAPGRSASASVREGMAAVRADYRAAPRTAILLAALIAVFAFLYVPLVLQIASAASRFAGTPPGPRMWSSPARLLIPWFPAFNSATEFGKLGDLPEGLGAGSPGWFLLIAAAAGLVQARRRIVAYVPLIVLFLLFVLYNPISFPTLAPFPWHRYSRIGSRFTEFYAVILPLCALPLRPVSRLGKPANRALAAALVLLGVVELGTAYSFKRNYEPYVAPPDFVAYMDRVKAQPGEAVMDFPFVVAGGNGIGGALSAFYPQSVSASMLPAFHGKKVMGQYFGRLHPSQMDPYLLAGWDKVLLAARRNMMSPGQESAPAIWAFLTDFFTYNDFCGVNLYVDLIPPDVETEFYRRFGYPAAETTVPGAGRVRFIPKPEALRKRADPRLGLEAAFRPALSPSDADLLTREFPMSILSVGLWRIYADRSGAPIRFGLGPRTVLRFYLPKSGAVDLSYAFLNPIGGQEVEMTINGAVAERFPGIPEGGGVERRLRFRGLEGRNEIGFAYKDWNHYRTVFAPETGASIAVIFSRLQLSVADR